MLTAKEKRDALSILNNLPPPATNRLGYEKMSKRDSGDGVHFEGIYNYHAPVGNGYVSFVERDDSRGEPWRYTKNVGPRKHVDGWMPRTPEF